MLFECEVFVKLWNCLFVSSNSSLLFSRYNFKLLMKIIIVVYNVNNNDINCIKNGVELWV